MSWGAKPCFSALESGRVYDPFLYTLPLGTDQYFLELHPESVFRYEPFGIFSVFSYEFNPGPETGPKRQRTILCTPRIVKYYNGT